MYQPQEDTALLIDAMTDRDLRGVRVLDLCTGSGAVAVAAARAGAQVTAVDSCPNAVAATRRRAAYADVELNVVHADLAGIDLTGFDPKGFGPEGFDLVTCNPPYVPTPPGSASSADGPSHAWNAGPDGRAVLDVLCVVGPRLLAPGGAMLIVQSELADVPRSLDALRAAGLRSAVVREREIPFGRVMTSRRTRLVAAGLLDPHAGTESIAVIGSEAPR
ncbi:methyltransferase domain-containing protein [Gordonia sp. HY285]|uniref:HemK2/MTQ2 family protein methyltransferase n=1 Tax=Gordonia liuliyuniae TaxID=2911517 RepID=UPI001F1BC840|nr:HemK2/MTQ2 family protein methyltransferase [Gordonia liuliyuniae]MCF8611187.1 methyltransferase domain-containing protein [Gordonia liuliyuniae]